MEIKFLFDDTIIEKYLPIVAYKEYITNGLWCCGYHNNELIFILPFIVKKRLIFRYLIAVNETIIVKEGYSEKEFLNNLIDKLKNEYDFIIQPTTNCVFNTFPDGAIKAPFGSYILNLELEENMLWKNIHSKHKNVIRRALKEGVEIKEGLEYFDDVYNLIYYTLEKNKIGIENKNSLKNKILNLKDNFLVIGSYYKGDIQSAAIIPFNKYKGYYVYGGSIDKPLLGSHNLLQWEVIKKLKSLGVKKYDFVGARIEPKTEKLKGIQRFKSRFGCELKKGYLWKYIFNKPKYFLYIQILKLLSLKQGVKFKADIIEQEKI
jgi:lipid II:glycine glycyltransferase (peptidoglycan interpeptide bridge formation enzyme)